MDIEARIRRRERENDATTLVADYEPLSPVAHVDEPTDRGPLLERLLDYLDPVFDGDLPPNAYLYGPAGAGKSAVVTALFAHLRRQAVDPRSVIYTSTRVRPTDRVRFVYVDSRRATSEFAFYHAVVDALTDDAVPEHGISTETLRERLDEQLRETDAGLLLAVDHVGDPGGVDVAMLRDLLDALPSNVSWLAVGRTRETQVADDAETVIEVPPYRTDVLADVLLGRATDALDRLALDRESVDRIAEWADGNAHDALAALFVATDRAERAGRSRIVAADVTAAIESVPQPCVSLGQVLTLPSNKQTVLRALVELDPEARATVSAATAGIAESVDLSHGTVERYIYEMAADGIFERVHAVNRNEKGRPPSRLKPRFPLTVFRRLYD